MKKIINIILVLSLSVFFVGCKDDTEDTEDTEDLSNLNIDSYYEKAVEYQEKLSDLIDNEVQMNMEFENVIEPLKFSILNSANDLDDLKKYPKEHFMDVYSNQPGYQNDIDRTEFLYLYKDLLDFIIEELEKNSIEELDVFIELNLLQFEDISVSCSFSSQEEIIFKLDYITGEFRIMTAFKTGYENDTFYVKELDYYHYEGDINYIYSEFYEDDYYMSINVNSEDDFSYLFTSVRTDEHFVLAKVDGVIEGQEEAYGGYSILWYDTVSQIRYNVGFSREDVVLSEYYEVFNDHGIVFSYIDYDTLNPEVRFAWNMLEASGWDYAYVDDLESSNPQPGDGIYKDDVLLFDGDKFNVGLNDNYANLRIEKEFNINEYTEEQLNLTEYGLTFSIENLNFDYIENLKYQASVASKDYEYFKGIDFFGNDIVSDFIDMIDNDITFDLDFS